MNEGKFLPVLFTDPNIGLRNQKIGIKEAFLTCSFSRDINSINETTYFDLNSPYYLLAAHGSIDPDSKQIHKHILTASSPVLINFASDSTVLISSGPTRNAYKVKAHGRFLEKEFYSIVLS